MNAMDKVLDANPHKSHEFIQAAQRLLSLKQQNPGLRMGNSNPLREQIAMTETTTRGIRQPRMSFMELSVYERKHGKAAPHKIKSLRINGEIVRGVDIMKEEDEARQHYFENFWCSCCVVFSWLFSIASKKQSLTC